MKDNWCKPYKLEDNRTIYGGASRNARIKQGGGLQKLLQDAALEAAKMVLDRVNEMQQEKRTRLRLVK